MNRFSGIFLFILFLFSSCNRTATDSRSVVIIKTTLGEIRVALYNETPLHRDNFIRLASSGLYEGIAFHRVISGFMIQAGDPMTKQGSSFSETDSIVNYTIPAEFNRKLFHKKGALAAARMGNDVNPLMSSSGTQFYIVQGKVLTEPEIFSAEQVTMNNIRQAYFQMLLYKLADSLKRAGHDAAPAEIQEMASLRLYDMPEIRNGYTMTPEQKAAYSTIGGVPRLDGTYTVFGEVIQGIETVDMIADVKTDENDKPESDVRILKMKVLK